MVRAANQSNIAVTVLAAFPATVKVVQVALGGTAAGDYAVLVA